MAKFTLKIDTTEAAETLRNLNKLAKNVTMAFKALEKASKDASTAMRECNEAMEQFNPPTFPEQEAP